MKIRTGFISNSSSSSFCIVGLADHFYLYEIFRQMGIDELEKSEYLGYGTYKVPDEHLECYGCDEPDYLGFSSNLLEHNNIFELRQKLINYIKEKYNINIPPERIGLHYGEVGN